MPSGKPVDIVSVIKPMRGGSQSFLVKGSDGAYYVAKFTSNPQGDRSLINEYIAGYLLRCLGVSAPDVAILRLGECCEGREKLYFSMESRVRIASGLHLGSRCPVDPSRTAIFDVLPRTLYPRVVNLYDLGLVFAFDQWVANVDSRQTIFTRRRGPKKAGDADPPGQVSLRCWAIDNGMCFGRTWEFPALPVYASCVDLHVYSHFASRESAHEGARLIQGLSEADLVAAQRGAPTEWFAPGDAEELDGLFNTLQDRRNGLGDRMPGHLDALQLLRG